MYVPTSLIITYSKRPQADFARSLSSPLSGTSTVRWPMCQLHTSHYRTPFVLFERSQSDPVRTRYVLSIVVLVKQPTDFNRTRRTYTSLTFRVSLQHTCSSRSSSADIHCSVILGKQLRRVIGNKEEVVGAIVSSSGMRISN